MKRIILTMLIGFLLITNVMAYDSLNRTLSKQIIYKNNVVLNRLRVSDNIPYISVFFNDPNSHDVYYPGDFSDFAQTWNTTHFLNVSTNFFCFDVKEHGKYGIYAQNDYYYYENGALSSNYWTTSMLYATGCGFVSNNFRFYLGSAWAFPRYNTIAPWNNLGGGTETNLTSSTYSSSAGHNMMSDNGEYVLGMSASCFFHSLANGKVIITSTSSAPNKLELKESTTHYYVLRANTAGKELWLSSSLKSDTVNWNHEKVCTLGSAIQAATLSIDRNDDVHVFRLDSTGVTHYFKEITWKTQKIINTTGADGVYSVVDDDDDIHLVVRDDGSPGKDVIRYYGFISSNGSGNTPPEIANVSPVNDSYIPSLDSLDLNVTLLDVDGNIMNASIRFYNNDVGSWQTWYFYDLITGDSIEATWSEQFNPGDTYSWTVNVTDKKSATIRTYSFMVPWLTCTMNESIPEIYCGLDGIPPLGVYGNTYIQYYDTSTFQSDDLLVTNTSTNTFGLDDYIVYGRSYLFRSKWPGFPTLYGNNYTFTLYECYEDLSPAYTGCAAGYICVNHTCYDGGAGCWADADCEVDEFCDNLTSVEVSFCDDLKGPGETCWRNEECISGDCNGDDADCAFGPCNYGWVLKADGCCHLSGTCVMDSQQCSSDTDCVQVNGSCYNTTGTGNQTCFCHDTSGYCSWKFFLTDSYCERDAWCLDLPWNTYQNESMSCLGNYCTPDSWECNIYGYGCDAGQWCNLTLPDSPPYIADHVCINCSMLFCSSDSECCSGNCMSGVCFDSGWECAGNIYTCDGSTSPGDEAWRCPAGQWCHHDSVLSNWTPSIPNGLCYAYLSVGSECECAYQCSSGLCEYAGAYKVCQNPGNESGNTTLNIDDWDEYTVGDFNNIVAFYQDIGNNILGASCVYTSNGITPNTGSLSYLPATGAYYASVEVANSPGARSYTVTCSRTGYPTLSTTDYFTVYPGNETATDVIWHTSPLTSDTGDSVTFVVDYETTAGVGVDFATCTLYLGVSSYTMTGQGGEPGRYYHTLTMYFEGAYSYHVSCSRTGYQTSSSYMRTLNVYDPGGEPPPPPPPHCEDGYLSGDETDVDCGGSCDPCDEGGGCNSDEDCASGWCHEGVCTSPTCSDGYMNGAETGIDCGGYCPPCGCFYNWDCAEDGSEHCSDSYECITDTCPPNCTSLYWYDNIHGYYYAHRSCFDGICRFSTENESSGGVFMTIISLSDFTWNDTGRVVYVSNCEDGTNGFTVITSLQTRKWYYHISPSYYSPYVPATGNIIFGGGEYETETTALLERLCQIPSDSDRVYSLVTFYALDESSLIDQRSVYTLTFKEAFTFEAEQHGTDQIRINLTRNGTCFFQNGTHGVWEQINTIPSDLILWNSSTQLAYVIQCNNSYGEFATGKFSGGVRGLFLFFLSVIVLFFMEMWLVIFGESFLWEAWYILPLIVICLFIFPLLVIIFLYAKRSKNENGDETEY